MPAGRHSLAFGAEPRTALADGGDLLQDAPFTDPHSGLKLRLPKNWVRKQGIADTGFEAPAKDRVAAGGLAPNIVLSKDAAPGIKPSDVDAVIASKRKQYAKVFSGYMDETPGRVVPNLPGLGVGRMDYSIVLSNVLRVRAVQIWILDKDQVYTITCLSLADTFPRNAATFDAALGTISIP